MLFTIGGNKVIRSGFYRDADLDFQTRGALGRAVRGGAEVGEVLATVATINRRSAWPAAWKRTAVRVQAEAETARDAGHLVSARSGFLRAASYWSCVVDGLLSEADSAELLDAFHEHRRCWDDFIDCFQGAHQRVSVPYGTTSLPGYLLRPDDSGTRRPTLIVTNGSDGAISDLWGSAAAGALARGWNSFCFDGPGQQAMLFDRNTHFRPDWEAVLTPVIDTLVARDDVDAERLTGYGISQGGFWLPKALASEHRLVAAVADPGVVDLSASWTKSLGGSMNASLEKGDRAAFNRGMELATRIPSLRRTLTARARPYDHGDWFDLYAAVARYRIDELDAAAITTPLLATDPDDEQFWPGQSRRLVEMVRAGGGQAELIRFRAAEGANFHVQPLGRLLTENRMFDWLEEHVH